MEWTINIILIIITMIIIVIIIMIIIIILITASLFLQINITTSNFICCSFLQAFIFNCNSSEITFVNLFESEVNKHLLMLSSPSKK